MESIREVFKREQKVEKTEHETKHCDKKEGRMRRPILALLAVPLLIFSIGAYCQAQELTEEECQISLIASFDYPGLGPVSGLAFDGKYLWAADRGANEIVKLKMKKKELKYVDSFTAPFNSPHNLTGLTFDGTDLWCTGTVEVRKMEIYQLTTSGVLISSFVTHGTDSTGLTYDGINLYNADWGGRTGGNPTIFIYETNGVLVDEYASPGDNPTDLAYGFGDIWHVDWGTNKIYRLDGSMNTICSCDNPVSELYPPLGLTFVEGYLWLTVEGTGKIYQLAID